MLKFEKKYSMQLENCQKILLHHGLDKFEIKDKICDLRFKENDFERHRTEG